VGYHEVMVYASVAVTTARRDPGDAPESSAVYSLHPRFSRVRLLWPAGSASRNQCDPQTLPTQQPDPRQHTCLQVPVLEVDCNSTYTELTLEQYCLSTHLVANHQPHHPATVFWPSNNARSRRYDSSGSIYMRRLPARRKHSSMPSRSRTSSV
jgi:hypothetical protein